MGAGQNSRVVSRFYKTDCSFAATFFQKKLLVRQGDLKDDPPEIWVPMP